MEILRLFYDCDEFCAAFLPRWHAHLLATQAVQRQRASRLSLSEVMTLIILFHQSGYRNFKTFYTAHVWQHLRREFPRLVSYNRFVELEAECVVPLAVFLHTRYGRCSGISFVDATAVKVCHNLRIKANRVFKDIARRGKTSVGWFYGFKVHLVINDRGELLGVMITPGNTDDRKPVPRLAKRLWGKLFGDRGYVSQPLFEQLWEHDVQLITKLKKNMKNKLLPLLDKLLLRKRALIEAVNDQLKNICQLEHTRHRSVLNFLVNLLAALIAYTYREKKPSLDLQATEMALLPVGIF
jgi:hypothetical protein